MTAKTLDLAFRKTSSAAASFFFCLVQILDIFSFCSGFWF